MPKFAQLDEVRKEVETPLRQIKLSYIQEQLGEIEENFQDSTRGLVPEFR